MSSSASRARMGGWLSVDDAAVMASTDPAARGSMSGALARFWRALCVGDYESARGNSVSLSRARGTSLAVASLPRTSRDDGSGDVDDTSARGAQTGSKPSGQFGATRLARYKPSNQMGGRFDSRSESGGVSETTDDDDGDGDMYDFEDDDDDEENASRDEASTPVTVTVTACVGFGKTSLVRLGTSCGARAEPRRGGTLER